MIGFRDISCNHCGARVIDDRAVDLARRTLAEAGWHIVKRADPYRWGNHAGITTYTADICPTCWEAGVR